MANPEPEPTVAIPEPQCWIDYNPREPEVYVPTSESERHCPLCQHSNSAAHVKSTISSPSYSPTEPDDDGTPAASIDREQLDKDLAEQLRRVGLIVAALDGKIARLEAILKGLQTEHI
jgi:hypothetical protein